MRQPTPLPPSRIDPRRLLEEHLTREESLLADMLETLRAVREGFFRRDLAILTTLQERQEQLQQTSQEIAAARERLRETLAPLLALPAAEVTLRGAALALEPPARERLLHRHARLSALLREAEQLRRHNASLLGYARGFLDCLFAPLSVAGSGERYGPQGERRERECRSFLEARV